MPDGRCWMLTNLAYGGGTSNDGANTYGDVILTGNGTAGTLSNGTSDTAMTYTEAKYYVPAKANVTIHPETPSTTTDIVTDNPQYGYFYNWCAAMGGSEYDQCLR